MTGEVGQSTNINRVNMARFFKAKQDTKLKIEITDSSQIDKSRTLSVAEGTLLETEDYIRQAADEKHLIVKAIHFLYGDHWEEIKPEIQEIVPRNICEKFFGKQMTDSQYSDLMECLQKFDIMTKPRIHHFFAQIHHESGGLKWLKEIADGSAYEGRKDLGNVNPGDGKRFKGGGVIQLTGRANYQRFANFVRDPDVMQGANYVANIYPFTSAGFWWTNNGMNDLIDRGATVREVTRRVNGGYNGLADREEQFDRIKTIYP
jgi:predicted chitinase